MLRTHSIILAIVRVLFKPDYFPLLALQRKGKLFDLHRNLDAASQLIYGRESDSDTD